MKRVIDGKRYDSDNAVKVCDIWEGSRSDFTHLDCTLYQTKRSKAFFLAGRGGAMTRFSHTCQDGSVCGGEKIIPLAVSEARLYVEKYGKPETVEEFFEVVEA
jgi:hypothetical protein